ncbi:uncharacterized protein Z519_09225 [Cladophialophora bantiana CBS 173.52]|uniref:Major facilitator superfamily (MFS) profile domain-containing protein n=1 Tax=Cladophialophora bantiana (strain ATCC 10958 / CBS 173.52 / CDC B-1940 / NIH 8579) TaxID=1442370 RepID=A0A0D2EI92_CLAB1|nr:uncharacterized protein Z519_09225 [Cladophialophora bantiana CBS 173.52]KIW89796.1 hypothetical protein Z519_09225 [Cladophialophora bantiana CBS 173.52]
MSQIENSAQTGSSEPYTIFTTPQKALIVTIVSFAATLSGFASNIYFPALPQVASDLSVSTTLVNLTVTCYLIFQGLSPTLWGSLADTKGRRITYLCTLVIFLGACIGLAETRSYTQLLVFRCVQSTGSASTIALGAGVIGDITKREERGGYMGVFQGGLLMPVAIGPVIGGVLADKLGWRSVFWFLTIYGGVCVLVIVLILPETLRSMVGNGSEEPKGYAISLLALYQRKKHLGQSVAPSTEGEKPATQYIDFMGPAKILFHWNTFCAIFYVAIHYTAWQMVLTAASTVVQHKYHTSEIQVGLIFLANGAGSIIGTILVGKFLDYDYRRILRKCGGDEQRIPIDKARLRTVWIWSALECVSVLGFGWTVDQGVHISVPIICFFVLGWAAISLQSVISTCLVDIHHTQSASAMASLNLVRCLLGAGGTAVVGPLISSIHVGWAFTLLTGVMLFLGGLVLVQIMFWNDWKRKLKRNSPSEMEEQSV